MAKDLNDLLNHDTCMIDGAKTVGAHLLRSVANDIDLDIVKWDNALRNYLETTEGGSLTKDKKARERNNINRTLYQPRITWKKFRKFLSILKPAEVKYTLNLKWEKISLGKELPKSITFISNGRYDDLHQLFRKLFAIVIDNTSIWDALVNRWIDKLDDMTADNPPDRSTEKGNIQKTILTKTNFTFELFCKALSILGIYEVELVVDIKWKSGKTTTHIVTFNTFDIVKETR